MVDRSFTDRDVLRIIDEHLDPQERAQVMFDLGAGTAGMSPAVAAALARTATDLAVLGPVDQASIALETTSDLIGLLVDDNGFSQAYSDLKEAERTLQEIIASVPDFLEPLAQAALFTSLQAIALQAAILEPLNLLEQARDGMLSLSAQLQGTIEESYEWRDAIAGQSGG